MYVCNVYIGCSVSICVHIVYIVYSICAMYMVCVHNVYIMIHSVFNVYKI